jgi:aryl carrier-like protein
MSQHATPVTAAGLQDEVLSWLRRELSDDSIHAQDNFLDVGGHSMMAIELNTWLLERHGIETDLVELFQQPIGWAVAAAAGRRDH